MSTPVVPNEGEIKMLQTILANLTIKVRLFQNDVTPAAASVYADFTEATFSGYPAGGATPSYGAVSTNGSGQAEATATTINFDHNGGATSNTIYGYYIVETGTSKVLKAEKFDAAVTMDSNGDRIQITEKMLAAGTIT